ncbi:MAG: three-Cys-motif partner protein TcmP [Microcella sp.]
MTKNDDFFKQSKAAQATLKHAILRQYLATFATATGTRSPGHRVGYIDGYAGAGEYVNHLTGNRTEGSPAIAINEVRHQLTLREPRTLECTFIEKDAQNYNELARLVAGAQKEGLPVEASKGDVTKLLAPAMERFQELPLLVFLDPFGASLPHSASIPAILGRDTDQPTEVLLNFSVETLRRAGARIHEPVNAKGREATLNRMDNWLGGDWWRQYFLDPDTTIGTDAAYEPAERITDEYARRVCKESATNVFPVEIRRAALHKPLFRLMLFHPKPLAAYKFNNAVSAGNEKWRASMWDMDLELAMREYARDPKLGGSRVAEIEMLRKIDPAQVFDDNVRTLMDNIRHALKTRQMLTMEHDFAVIYGSAIGSARGTHLTKAWDALTEEGVTAPRKGSTHDWAKIYRADRPVQFEEPRRGAWPRQPSSGRRSPGTP